MTHIDRPGALDPRWREQFVLSLRMRDVPADTIADQLKLVESHCAESGEAAAEAFGEPADHARSIAGGRADEGAGAELRDLLRLLPVAVGAFLAGSCAISGALAFLGDGTVQVRLGDVVAAVLLVALSLLLLPVMARLRRPMGPVMLLVTVVTATAVLLSVAGGPHLLDLPGWVAALVGLAGLLSLGVWGAREGGRQRIVDPVDGRPMF